MIDKKLHSDIGKRVKLIRLCQKISQKEVALFLGISQTHMSNMENGVVGFTVDNIVKLGEFFKCDMNCFFDDVSVREYEALKNRSENLIIDKKILSRYANFAGLFEVDSETVDKILRIVEIIKK